MNYLAFIEQKQTVRGGIPVFAGTSVPVQILLEYLSAGQCIDDFLDDFPTVQRSQAIGVLEQLKHLLLTHSYVSAA
ncbi:MAG: DUF433 domain-containing protein [Chloroflexota bacterium]